MFMASRLTKSENRLIFLAGHSPFSQYSVFTPFSLWILVFPPQTGQVSGMFTDPLLVRFSAIWGMIMFAL